MAGTVDGYLAQLVEQGKQIQSFQAAQRDQLARETERLRGIKTGFRLPILIKTGSNPFSVGGDFYTQSGQMPQKPDEGYAWALRHLVIEGMSTGATPDVINILRAGRVIWQLNGNQFAQTWGRGELWVRP